MCVTLNYQLIQNSLGFENSFFMYLQILKKVQIRKNNIKNSFYKGIGALAP
jgi:hypothetical protein